MIIILIFDKDTIQNSCQKTGMSLTDLFLCVGPHLLQLLVLLLNLFRMLLSQLLLGHFQPQFGL